MPLPRTRRAAGQKNISTFFRWNTVATKEQLSKAIEHSRDDGMGEPDQVVEGFESGPAGEDK